MYKIVSFRYESVNQKNSLLPQSQIRSYGLVLVSRIRRVISSKKFPDEWDQDYKIWNVWKKKYVASIDTKKKL